MQSYPTKRTNREPIISVSVSFWVDSLIRANFSDDAARAKLARQFTGRELDQALKLYETLTLIIGDGQ